MHAMFEVELAAPLDVSSCHLDVGIGRADIILPRQRRAEFAIAQLVMNARHRVGGGRGFVVQGEEMEVAHQLG